MQSHHRLGFMVSTCEGVVVVELGGGGCGIDRCCVSSGIISVSKVVVVKF